MSPRPSMSGANSRRKSRYRKGVAFPLNLCKQCHINLEEGNHIGAITLLTDSLLSGTSHPDRADINVFAPLPFHIEIVSILLVHPTTTTQSSPDLRAELASRCISFLRSTLAILGPLNAKLGEAFSYHHPKTGRRRRRRAGYDSSASSNSDDEEEELQSMRCTVAREGRIRNCAKDFWHVVGWALNCSVAYPPRWKYWQVWLDYMLDVLDADWNEREAQDLEEVGVSSRMELGDRPELECSFPRLHQSLLADYLYDIRGSTAVKRVVGAAFADAGPDDLRTYPEVFKNETQKVRPPKRKREEQNLELNSSDFESGGPSSSLASPSSSPQDVDDKDSTDPWLGGPDSMILRQRVLTLLSRICHYLPDRFISLTDLYALYYTNMKLLPIPAFSLLFSQSRSLSFPTEVYVSITQSVLSRLLQNGAPSPQDYHALDPDDQHNDEITQHILEHCYLPWAAATSSVSDNAKVSILLECLLRLLLKKVGLSHASRLEQAIETGIRAREGKAKQDGRRRRRMDGEEERDREWLAASGERLRGLVGVVEGFEGDG